MRQHRVELQIPPDLAWERLQAAAASIGTIERADQATKSLVVRTRGALGSVRLQAAVLTAGPGGASIVDVQGGGVSARRAIARLVARLTSQ